LIIKGGKMKVQDFIKYLKKNYGVKITKKAYDSYRSYYFTNSTPIGNDKKISEPHRFYK